MATPRADITSRPWGDRAISAFEVYEENRRSIGDTWDRHKSGRRRLVTDGEAENRPLSRRSHGLSRRF